MTSGVPQGTVLDPLLSLLYINDLPDNLQCFFKLVADDALLYGIIANDKDCDLLLEDLQKLEQWQNQWQMQFNPSKCKLLCISDKRYPPVIKYTFRGDEMEQVENITYLGITLTSKPKWNQHVSTVSRKASKVHGVVRRNLHNCPRSARETSVRPTLEYGSDTWDPFPVREEYSKTGESSEKGSAILREQVQPLCKRDRNASGTLATKRKTARISFMY